jgi:hypothetical protein
MQLLHTCNDSAEATNASVRSMAWSLRSTVLRHLSSSRPQQAALLLHRVSTAMPRALRDAQLQHRLVMQTLASEKQRAIAALRLALPLHWKRAPPGLGRAEEPAFIRICGAVLPVCGDSSATSAEQLGAGLGSLLHYVSLAARYLACPLLHVGSYRGSTSTVWRRTSFWSDAGSTELPLHRGDVIDEGSTNRLMAQPWPSTWSSTAQKVGVLAKGIGLTGEWGPLTSADTWSTPGPGPVRLVGFSLLSRSISLLCAHELGLAGSPAPPRTWSPLVLLAALSAGLAKPPTPPIDTPVAQPLRTTPLPASDDAEDWEHVHLLPPPPGSADGELLLWERLVSTSSSPPRPTLL